MTELNVRNILANEQNRNFFKERVIAEEGADIYEPAFKKFFEDNLTEFARIDKMYAYEVWKGIKGNEKKKFEDFEKKLEENKGQKSKGVIDNKISAKEFMDKYFPKVKIWKDSFYNKEVVAYPRQAKELNLSQEVVNNLLAKEQKDKGSIKVCLTGELDLSDWENLESLNLSRNVLLEKIDISKNLKLKEIFLNSSPAHQLISHNQRMNLNNLVVADEYKQLKTLTYYGSTVSDSDILNKLKKNTTAVIWSREVSGGWEPVWDIKWVEVDNSGNRSFAFSALPKSELSEEIEWMFEEFEEKASDEEFTKHGLKGAFKTLIDEIGGNKFEITGEIEFEDEHGVKQKKTYTYHGGDIELASKLYRILKKPPPPVYSWDDFAQFVVRKFSGITDVTKRQKELQKYFPDCPEGKIDTFLNRLKESIEATIDEKKTDRDQFYLLPSVKEKTRRQVRGKEMEEEVIMPKKPVKNEKTGGFENRTVPFKELVPFSEFKIGRK
jgi:hypothetical protein